MACPCQVTADAKSEQFEHVGDGLFSQVWRVKNTDITIKIPDDPGEASVVEKNIYDRISPHPFILQCYGESESTLGKGLVLRYLPGGTLKMNLDRKKYLLERTQWPIQAAEAIQHIHSKGVVHCDIGAHNFLIQNGGSLALADFCGSILDGSPAFAASSSRYTRPLTQSERLQNPTVKDDLFALGTLIYEIGIGHELYPDKSDIEIARLIQNRQFPGITDLPLRAVIEKCWQGQYDNAKELKLGLNTPHPHGPISATHDVAALRESHAPSVVITHGSVIFTDAIAGATAAASIALGATTAAIASIGGGIIAYYKFRGLKQLPLALSTA